MNKTNDIPPAKAAGDPVLQEAWRAKERFRLPTVMTWKSWLQKPGSTKSYQVARW